jgi:hypothetical protein
MRKHRKSSEASSAVADVFRPGYWFSYGKEPIEVVNWDPETTWVVDGRAAV